MKNTLVKFYAGMLRTKGYVDGFYAGMLRVLSAAFIYNCVLFNADRTVIHVGTAKAIGQMSSVLEDAHAEDKSEHINVDTRCDRYLGNIKNWRICREKNDKQ